MANLGFSYLSKNLSVIVNPLSFMFFNNLKSTMMTIMNVIVGEYSKIIKKKSGYEFVDPELSPFTSFLLLIEVSLRSIIKKM
jgi:hypothetical protein